MDLLTADVLSMTKVWDIRLYHRENRGSDIFRVIIRNQYGHEFSGEGPTALAAQRDCECRMVIKPWIGAPSTSDAGAK